MRFLRVYTQENGGSMPLEALSAKARLIVPVGAHALRDARGRLPCLGAVVLEPEHDERVAQAGEAQADAALRHRLAALLLERPRGDVEDVVEHADRHLDVLAEALEVEARLVLERIADEAREIDAAEAAAAVGRQRLLGARVGGLDGLAVGEVV